MVQKHPYCRTCGSQIQSKDVCHHCGCEPLKGNNYCCDCGTSTVAEAIICVHCGASFQRKFPATLAVLISIAIVVTLAGAGYFITESGKEPSEKISDAISTNNSTDSTALYKASPPKKIESGKIIINNIPTGILKKRNDAINRIAKSLSQIPQSSTENIISPEISKINKEEAPVSRINKTAGTSERINMNVFSAGEIRNYYAGCTYFTGRSKKNVVFFTTNVYGYVKINGKVYALQGIQKGNDIARFSGAGYEVTIEIEGLAGNEKEWLAEATMIVKDIRQKTLSHHKIYSTCTDF